MALVDKYITAIQRTLAADVIVLPGQADVLAFDGDIFTGIAQVDQALLGIQIGLSGSFQGEVFAPEHNAAVGFHFKTALAALNFETGFGLDGDVPGIVQMYFGILTGHQSSCVGFII